MRHVEVPSYPVSIFVAGDPREAETICRAYCDQVGLCVTVTETTYVFTGGEEAGVIIGLINYPRFPAEPHDIRNRAVLLAEKLRVGLRQESYTVQTPDATEWFSFREGDA
jgi:hypothetical protein